MRETWLFVLTALILTSTTRDAGAGLLVFFGQTVGVRGEVRYYHSSELLDLLGIDASLSETTLDFWRVSGGIVFYTTCPRCAKHYGRNCVVGVAKVR